MKGLEYTRTSYSEQKFLTISVNYYIKKNYFCSYFMRGNEKYFVRLTKLSGGESIWYNRRV